MVLARFRRSSRFIAALLLASFWGLSHRASDDACAIDLLQSHDESKHVVGAPDAGAPDHCAVCHSVRTPRRPFGTAAHLSSPGAPGSIVDLPDTLFRRLPALENLPARAPPATLT